MDYSPWVAKSWTRLSHAAGRCCCLKLPKNPHHPCCPGFFLQALQISLQSNDSTAPAPGMVFPGSGRLPLGTGIRETRGDMERGRGGDQRRVSSQGQRTLRVVSCVGGFISPLHYYLKDKAVLSNSRGSIFPLCSHYLENSESEHGNNPACDLEALEERGRTSIWKEPETRNEDQVTSLLPVRWIHDNVSVCVLSRDPMGCSPPGSSLHGIFQA